MSLTPWDQLFSVGGFLEYVHSNSYIFSDSTSNDVALYMDYIDQNILFGTHQGIPSCMRVTSNEVQMNYHAFVNNNLGIGTSNVRSYDTPHRLVIEGESNSMIDGAHWAAYVKGDPVYPLFQQYNNNHDEIVMSFDVFWTGCNWVASDSNVFQLKKHDGKFQVMCACNLMPGDDADLDLYPALTINSNSYIGVGTSNPKQKFSIAGPCNSYDGPHISFYVNEDNVYPLLQILNLDHDNIAQGYDAFWNGSNWISCSETGNFKIEKSFGQFGIFSAYSNLPGDEPLWDPAFIINSNSFIGINTYNTTHRLTVSGPDASFEGPHLAIYTDTDLLNPVYQQLNWSQDLIAQSYGAYYTSNAWISSSSNASYKIEKYEGKLVFQSACNVPVGSNIDWQASFTIDYLHMGFGTSNPTHMFTLNSHPNSMDGPHIAAYSRDDPNYPIYQQLNWDHDDISQSYDCAYDGNDWISSESNVFQLKKYQGQFLFSMVSNTFPGDIITNKFRPAMLIDSNSFIGIGALEATHRLTIAAEDQSFYGPHLAIYTDKDPDLPIYQQLNWSHDLIAQSYDAYYTSNGWISTSSNGNYKQEKYGGKYVFQSASNVPVGSNIDWQASFTIDYMHMGFGTSNPTHMFTLNSHPNSMDGPHIAAYSRLDPNYPIYQQLNWDHDDISQSYDCAYDGNDWISSDSNVFQLKKYNGQFLFSMVSNTFPGDIITNKFRPAMLIDSNSFIGIGALEATHRLTIAAEDQSFYGPHLAIYTDADQDYPIYQQLNWSHDLISQAYDAYYTSNGWISTSSNGNYKIEKHDAKFMIHSAFNTPAGCNINWNVAFTVDQSSLIGIGTSNPSHRLTIKGDSESYDGPHSAVYTSDDSNYPLYQALNWKHDDITQSYDCFFDGNDWISSDSNVFQVQKFNGRFMIRSACNLAPGSIANAHLRTAFTVNSNSFIGIGTQFTPFRVTMRAEDANILGPHLAYYTNADAAFPVFQQLNWKHDDIHLGFDAMYTGIDWVSSYSNGNFKIGKQNGQFTISSACNTIPGIPIEWNHAFCISSSNGFVGIGTTSPEFGLHVAEDCLVESNIILGGDIMPMNDMTQDLGSSNYRFKDLWLSGGSIDMEDLKLRKDSNSGGLLVYDAWADATTTILVKEIILGDSTDSTSSNLIYIQTCNNELRFKDSDGNFFTGIANLYTDGSNLGIGTSNLYEALNIEGSIDFNNMLIFDDNGSFGFSNAESFNIYDAPLMLSNDTGSTTFFSSNSCLGINKSNPHFAVDIQGDLNITGGYIYVNDSLLIASRWTASPEGIYVMSNIGINTTAKSNYSIDVAGDINFTGTLYNNSTPFQTSRWTSDPLNGIYVNSNVGINGPADSNYALTINGDINFLGTLYNNSNPFQTSRWTSDPLNGIYVESNVGINGPADSNYALTINGDININGTIFSNSNLFQSSRWSYDPPNGISINSNVGIQMPADSNYALSISGSINIDRDLRLRGLQISKSAGTQNNISQQIYAIPGVSNTNSNVFFYKGLYMKGIRLNAGDASATIPATIATPWDSNLLIPIPSSSSAHAIRFLTGSSSNEVMTILGTGDIGINNVNPAYKFDVNGDINFTGELYYQGNRYLQWSNMNSNVFIIGSNVGINTIPNYPLDVQGAVNFTSDPSDIALRILNSNLINNDYLEAVIGSDYNNSNSGYLKYTHFGDQSSNIMQIGITGRNNITCSSDGFVGINKEDPDYTLHVEGDLYVSGDSICLSDERFKTNITPIEEALDKLDQIHGYTYDPLKATESTSSAKRLSQKRVGVLAQELEKVMPELVYEDNNGFKSVAYANLTALLLQAIKELKQELKEVKGKVNNLMVF